MIYMPAPRAIAINTAVLACLIALCVVSGLMVAVSPEFGAMAILVAAAGATFFLGLSPTRAFLSALVILLSGYVFLGRGAAYIGVYPLYVSEMVLSLAVLQIFVAIWGARIQPLHWLLLAFMLFGLFRTIPFVGTYGIDALRDSVIWAYALFAFALSITLKRSHFEWIYRVLNRWLPWAIVLGAALYLAQLLLQPYLPRIPSPDNLSIIAIRPGEIAVHLGGMGAFLILGLYASGPQRLGRGNLLLYVMVAMGLLIMSTMSRGGFLGVGSALFVALLFLPSVRFFQALGIAVLVLPLILIFAPQASLGSREVTIDQSVRNITSIVAPEEGTALEGTRSWREEWWDKIIGYTVEGPYFWTGKGFGINLANDDGFAVDDAGTLRSPHNGHLTILARMGVPGLFLWLTFGAVFALTLLRTRSIFLRRDEIMLAGMAAWILAYLTGAWVNMAFDVYLEGPQGGIWFWSLVGLGMALAAVAIRPDEDRLNVPGGSPIRRPIAAVLPQSTFN